MEKLREELEQLERIEKAAEADLKKAPQGTLRISKSNNVDQYYWRTDSKDTKGRYIRKGEEKLIKSLAQKDYAQKVKGILEPIIRKRRKMLSQIEKIPVEKQLLEVYDNLSLARQKLITPYIYGEEEFIKQWECEKMRLKERIGSELDTEIFTERGECVRSKSEKILADKLYMMNIPYLYEVPLYLKGYGYIKPDFTVLNRRTRKEYYWEHLGMMNDEAYCEKAIKKIESLEKDGNFPGKNLILTYETTQHPLNVKIVERLIEEYLL